MNTFATGLDSLMTASSGRSRAITMENPTGAKGEGGKAAGLLGPSRKGAPAIITFKSGETRVLADMQYRRDRETTLKENYVILDGVKGKGHYVGTYIAITALERYWYGEGELKVYLDGDKEYPTICGTGFEDYFGGAWGFVEDQRKETPAEEVLYQTPFQGFPFFSAKEPNFSWRFEGTCPPMRGFYRWHIMDPIHFQEDIKITMQQMGNCRKGYFERQDDYASVAYWYQTEPHAPFPKLPDKEYRWPR